MRVPVIPTRGLSFMDVCEHTECKNITCGNGFGLCLNHFLEALDEHEKLSRDVKLTVGTTLPDRPGAIR